MTPRLLLRCGCVIGFADGDAPICPTHGTSGVARVIGMPKPRFRGCASGPLVRTMELPPSTARFVESVNHD